MSSKAEEGLANQSWAAERDVILNIQPSHCPCNKNGDEGGEADALFGFDNFCLLLLLLMVVVVCLPFVLLFVLFSRGLLELILVK